MAKPEQDRLQPNTHSSVRQVLSRGLLLGLATLGLCGFPWPASASEIEEAAQAIRLGDYDHAAGLLQRAAKAGDAEAQYQLASLARSGRGMPKSHKTAFRWFAAAAKQGHPKAQYSLGKMYQNGWGVAADRAHAVQWFKSAADQGHRLAKQELQAAPGPRRPALGSATSGLKIERSSSGQELRRAVRKADKILVQALLHETANLDEPDAQGRGVLHDAVERGQYGIARLLLRSGADPDLADLHRETPLHQLMDQRRRAGCCWNTRRR
jgi:TPR repeat protein